MPWHIPFSWALYDFANTIFSAIVLTAYFPLYLTERAGANWHLGAATTGSMILAGIVTPVLGSISDQTGQSKKYLITATLVCICFLIPLGLANNVWLLILFFTASCLFYHSALVFYNSLLPIAASAKHQGFVSGLGTGLGYLGVVCALPLAHWVDSHFSTRFVFLFAAAAFLLFSLPLFIFVPERKITGENKVTGQRWKSEWGKIISLLKTLPENPQILYFFIGNFFVVDALNSTIFWLSVYVRESFHPGQAEIIRLLIGINLGAFLAGILTGILTDRWGAAKTLLLSAGLLTLTLLLLAFVTDYKKFVIICITGGAFSIAGIWTAGRKRLIEIAPKESLGEYFGLYGLTTKISVIGSLVFSLIADSFGFKSALLSLVLPALTGFLCLWKSHPRNSV